LLFLQYSNGAVRYEFLINFHHGFTVLTQKKPLGLKVTSVSAAFYIATLDKFCRNFAP